MGRDTMHQIRLPRAPSNLVLSISLDEQLTVTHLSSVKLCCETLSEPFWRSRYSVWYRCPLSHMFTTVQKVQNSPLLETYWLSVLFTSLRILFFLIAFATCQKGRDVPSGALPYMEPCRPGSAGALEMLLWIIQVCRYTTEFLPALGNTTPAGLPPPHLSAYANTACALASKQNGSSDTPARTNGPAWAIPLQWPSSEQYLLFEFTSCSLSIPECLYHTSINKLAHHLPHWLPVFAYI